MGVRNLHWYNQNEGTAYPLDETASCRGADGAPLPPDIITDLNLRWPGHLGNHAFVSSVSVTPSLVTVTIQAADGLDDDGLVPLAVVSVPKPVAVGRVYPLLPQLVGVGGWIVFGQGVDDRVPYAGRFPTPRDGLLAPRAARPYTPVPVTSLGAVNQAAALTGVVRLTAEDPLVIAREERTIDGVVRDCVVVRLADGAGLDGFPQPEQAGRIVGFARDSVFKRFAGPCAGRPESNTCGTPEPIEFINAVAPDCDGVITLEFTGCAAVTRIDPECGIVIDCGVGLVDACLPAQVPSSAGLLPDEYVPSNIPPYDPPPTPEPPPGPSESSVVVGGLPFLDCFSHGAGAFTVRYGAWHLVADDSPDVMCPDELSASSDSGSVVVRPVRRSYGTNTAASRNVAVWEGFDEQTVFRRVTADVKMTQGPPGALHNAGLVLNFRPHQSVAGQFVYFLAEVDWDAQTFRVSRFNGTAFQAIVPVVVPGIQLDKWYRITADVVAVGAQTRVTAGLTSVSDPGVTDVEVTVTTNNYRPSTGWFGLGTNRAVSRFSYMKVEASA